MQPLARAGLYAPKPTIGSTELGGIFAVSEDFDAVGAMAKSTLDLAVLSELLLNPQARSQLPPDGYLSFLKKDFRGLSIGFVDPEKWQWPEVLQRQEGNSLQQLVDKPRMRCAAEIEDNICLGGRIPGSNRADQEPRWYSCVSCHLAASIRFHYGWRTRDHHGYS